ncbi:hypothetical protein P1J78_05145 [Psychromarinibacter sp. C21-152]|uniref:Uncharacterized protein n=1 Tax=Psychromarinibacter sediminicola TaxID=3033385 RepID=A0AAE3T7A1_9RHOB|nr:hypothetical protein [Psychromarinibacter sediminicola]MDF0600110.1 hypothetical protein [Psychromarinibacter sediminicola]
MTRLLVILALATACVTTARAGSLPFYAHERAQTFAVCSGRLSALAVRQSAMEDPEATATRRLMQDFDMLLEATLPAAYDEGVPERQPRVWRARGWTEIAGLLRETHDSPDAGRAERAAAQLTQRIRQCRDLILPANGPPRQ